LTVGGDNTSPAAFAGVISGTGGLSKIGTGTQTLSGANTYQGNTVVSAGTLKLDATGTIANSTPLSIANGATFDVSGKTSYDLTGVSLTIAAGSGGSGSFDAGTAALTFGGNLTIDLSTATPDATYYLFALGSHSSNFDSVALSGSFAGSLTNSAASLWTGPIGGYNWSLDLSSGALSATSAIPEPSTYAAMLGLGALGFAAWRRRRSA
jgi:autotransporter-associated beta strand protein